MAEHLILDWIRVCLASRRDVNDRGLGLAVVVNSGADINEPASVALLFTLLGSHTLRVAIPKGLGGGTRRCGLEIRLKWGQVGQRGDSRPVRGMSMSEGLR